MWGGCLIDVGVFEYVSVSPFLIFGLRFNTFMLLFTSLVAIRHTF